MPLATKEAQREYQRQWIAKRRADYFDGKSCVNCGSLDKLELDHIDPSTKIDSHIWSWSITRREEELVKCQVLCHTCHLEKTLKSYPERQHGTSAMYKQENCRCVECRAYIARVKREWRKRTGRH